MDGYAGEGYTAIDVDAVEESTHLLHHSSADSDELYDEELRWNERVCIGCGWMSLSLLCTTLGGYSLNEGHLSSFATLGTLSVFFSLCSTFTFFGVRRSLETAFEPSRRIACLLFITSLTLTFTAGYQKASVPVLILCCAFFYLSQAWYVLTFIPYGRQSARSCGRAFCMILSWV
eukprot:TRINITY_DN66989_c0_g1_i1.p1 TRINITY_DN66989_c0_g1~~TRINITY_DN66989_c0_g1_i1.p1  ORF type:complete len:193 (+),score=55.73 TRINITY_DN66989_c0_g1_i1:56-580(+)